MWTDIIIQGRGDFSAWVTSFRVAITVNGFEWKIVNDNQQFQGNFDRNTKRRVTFNEPIFARAIRIYP